jgi:hypothetical protein
MRTSPLVKGPRICSVEGCDKTVYAKGLCQRHWKKDYQRRQAIGLLPAGRRRVCSEGGCDGLAVAKKLCRKHYRRLSRTGTTADPIRVVPVLMPPDTRDPLTCAIKSCGKSSRTRGFCTMHYQRSRKLGLIQLLPRMRTCSEEGCGKQPVGHGLCSKHYQRAKIHTLSLTRGVCTAASCGRPATVKGLCPLHYQRMQTCRKTSFKKRPYS